MGQDRYWVRYRGIISGPHSRERLIAAVQAKTLGKFHDVSEDKINWTLANTLNWLFPAPDQPTASRPQNQIPPQYVEPIPKNTISDLHSQIGVGSPPEPPPIRGQPIDGPSGPKKFSLPPLQLAYGPSPSGSYGWFIDFMTFRIFITPILIIVLFALGVLALTVTLFVSCMPDLSCKPTPMTGFNPSNLSYPQSAMSYGGSRGTPFFYEIVGYISALLVLRIFCEALIVLFSIHDRIKELTQQNKK